MTTQTNKAMKRLATEGNKGNEDQPFVALVSFCSKLLFSAGAFLFLSLATSVHAQFTYTTNDGTITITGYTGQNESVMIPSTINGLPVTHIGTNAFYGCFGLTSVTIPASVLTIGAAAFEQCRSLTNVTLSLSLLDICSNAFDGCRLPSITVPATVTTIGDYAFNNCGWLTNANFLGNAPDADSTVFSFSNGVLPQWGGVVRTAYYLPGTTGWAAFATNTGVPTALWTLPYPLVLNGSSGAQSNQFGFTISWATNVPVVVEASADLSNPAWIPLSTNTLSGGTSSFSDPDWTNYPNRFYRLRSQ
jgi:hypothetical protein